MNVRQKTITLIFCIGLIFISLVSLSLGQYKIELSVIGNWFCHKLGFTSKILFTKEEDLILSDVRLPRIILVSLVGSSLAISGTVLQSVFKNPLVSPFILGISSGASFGVSLIMVFFHSYDLILLQTAGFSFGSLAVLSVLLVSKLFSSHNTIALVLSGVIISAFFTSLVSLLQYFSEEQKLQSILFWTFGSFSNSSWQNVAVVFPINLICSIILVTQS